MTGEDAMNDDDIGGALAPYRQVRGSERLRVAVTRPGGRSSQPALPRRHPRVVVVGAMAVAAAAAVVVTAAIDDADGGRVAPGVEAAGVPIDISGARAVVFADGTTVSIEELFEPANHERLQTVFADHGAELVIVEQPVAPAADGRVFSVSLDPDAVDDPLSDTVRVEPGVRVEVEVGRGDPAAGTAGLTLYEVFPDVEAAIVRDDPVATGLALEGLGFQVRWVLIEAAGAGGDVPAPPAGTVVLSVLGPEGEWTDIDPTMDTLMVEVATPAVAEDLGH